MWQSGRLTFGSSGLGGAHHLSGEMLRAAGKQEKWGREIKVANIPRE
jgi:hypothetical protein